MKYGSCVAVCLLLLAAISSAFGQSSAQELGQLYVGGQLDAVIAQGVQALQTPGRQPVVRLLVGRAYADKREFRAALPYLRQSATDSLPDVQAWSQAYLGTCYYALQDYPSAQAAFKEVVAAAATRNATAYAAKRLGLLRAQALASTWQTLETDHFRFHFQPPAGENLAAYAAAHEQAYAAINSFFQAQLPRKVDYYVWGDPAVARQVLGQNLGFTQSELMTIHVLRNQTTGHETAHLLLDYGGQPMQKNRLINEGIAVYFDQSTRDRLQTARQASGGPVDVWKMWEQPQAFSDQQLYAVGGALLEYLLAHSSAAAVQQLLRDQTPQLGRQLFSQQVADFELELAR